MGAIHSIVFGQMAQYGPEVLFNGTFNNDTGWTLGAGWTIGGGEAHKALGGGSLSTGATMTAGAQYEVSFTLRNYAGGGAVYVSILGDSTVTGTPRSADGTFTEVLSAPAAASDRPTIRLDPATGSETFSVDNFSIRRKYY